MTNAVPYHYQLFLQHEEKLRQKTPSEDPTKKLSVEQFWLLLAAASELSGSSVNELLQKLPVRTGFEPVDSRLKLTDDLIGVVKMAWSSSGFHGVAKPRYDPFAWDLPLEPAVQQHETHWRTSLIQYLTGLPFSFYTKNAEYFRQGAEMLQDQPELYAWYTTALRNYIKTHIHDKS